MRLVLDTHIWIWSLVAPERLSSEVRAALTVSGHELWLSAISVWEALVLIRKGRMRLAGRDGPTWVAEALTRSPVREAPITNDIAIASEQLALDHWDPADRLIAATAHVLGATLITADARLITCTGIATLNNR